VLEASLGSQLAPNLLSEAVGIFVETAIIGVILNLILNRRDQRRWGVTRCQVGQMVGSAHTSLAEYMSYHRNAFVAAHSWARRVRGPHP
jgi:cadmium resistance protein CadD (predicted permease)